jgi:hypothetical protein
LDKQHEGAGLHHRGAVVHPLGRFVVSVLLNGRDLAEGESQVSSYPNIRQRDILQMLMRAEWTPRLRLAPAGESMLATLVERGWIERRIGDGAIAYYRITESGRQAFRRPVPLR